VNTASNAAEKQISQTIMPEIVAKYAHPIHRPTMFFFGSFPLLLESWTPDKGERIHVLEV